MAIYFLGGGVHRCLMLLVSAFLVLFVNGSIANSPQGELREKSQQPTSQPKANESEGTDEPVSTIVTETLEDGSLSAVVTIVGDAGQLSTIITEDLRTKIKKLKVSGNITGPDILLIRQMCCALTYEEERQGVSHPFVGILSYLDLTDAVIVYDHSGRYDSLNQYFTEGNVIGDDMFRKSILETIYLPTMVKSISSGAFSDCPFLLDVHFTGPKVPEWDFDCNSRLDVYVPGDCMEQYKAKYGQYEGWCISIISGPDFGVVNETINVSEAGEAYSQLTNPEKTCLLKVKGTVNAWDMRRLGELVKNYFLTELDLSEASIVSSDGTVVDVLTNQLNYDLRTLDVFVLPNSIKELSEDAMRHISYMGNFSVTATNPNFKYVDNVLYSADGKKLVYLNYNIRKEVFNIPEGTETIGCYALRYSNVDVVNCPSSLRTIEYHGLFNCRAKYINLNQGIQTLGDWSLAAINNLKTLEIPEGVSKISNYAFSNSSIVKIKLPSTVSYIADNAFSYNYSLKAVEIRASAVPTIEENTFRNVTVDNVTLYVGTGMKESYNAADYWSVFTNVVEGSAPLMGIAKDELAILKSLYDKTDGSNWRSKWNVDWNKEIYSLYGVDTEQKEDGLYHVTRIRMSSNNLSGELPADLFDLPYLTYLYLPYNQLTGDIGKLFEGRTPKATALSTVTLYNNQFEGDLYPFASALKGLQRLDMDNNNLTDMSQALPSNINDFYAGSQFSGNLDEAPLVENVNFSTVRLSDFTQPLGTYNINTREFESPKSAYVSIEQQEGENMYSYRILSIKDGIPEIYYNPKLFPVRKGDILTLLLRANGDHVSSYYRVKADFYDGDANLDGEVTVDDLQLTVSKVTGGRKSLFFGSADTYADGVLNVQDMVVTANIILDSPGNTSSNAKTNGAEDAMTDNWLVAVKGGVSVELADSVAALDLMLSGCNADDVALALPSSDWMMMKKQTENGVRVIVFSPTGASLAEGVSEVLKVEGGLGYAAVVKATSPSVTTVVLGTRSATGISATDAEAGLMDIYDYSGRLVKSNATNADDLQPGTYILHDKANDTKKKLNITKR